MTGNSAMMMLQDSISGVLQQAASFDAMFVSVGVVRSYENLAQSVLQTELAIRSGTAAQEEFDQAVTASANKSGALMTKVKGLFTLDNLADAAGKVLALSDAWTQATAHLGQMNDGMQSTGQLTESIYQSAQRSRGSFLDMANTAAQFAANSGDAFGSSDEIVAFTEQMQKQMQLSGASPDAANAATLQLSQGLSSGVVSGDALRSVADQAPMLMQSIASYLDIPRSKVQELADEGQITAEILKNAMFAAAEETDAKFAQMPMTFGQLWQEFQNSAMMAFGPVLARLNEVANSAGFQAFVDGLIGLLTGVATVVTWIIELVANVAGVIADNWSWIAPIILGIVAALIAYNALMGIEWLLTLKNIAGKVAHAVASAAETAAIIALMIAQDGLNAALAACPITWIIVAIILLIAVIYAVCAAIAKFTGIAGTGLGVVAGGVNVVIAFFKNLALTVANIALGISGAIGALAQNIMVAFHNAICSVQAWWYGLLSTILTVIGQVAAALNDLPFVEFDYSGLTAQADEYARRAQEAEGSKEEYQSISDAFNKGFHHFDTFQDGWAAEAFQSGAAWGDRMSGKLSDFFGGSGLDGLTDSDALLQSLTGNGLGAGGASTLGNIAGGVSDIAGNTSGIADSAELAEEDLKYLRDIAEQEAVNRFTTAAITIEQTNHNRISGKMDLDGVITGLTDAVNEAVDVIAEGVHS